MDEAAGLGPVPTNCRSCGSPLVGPCGPVYKTTAFKLTDRIKRHRELFNHEGNILA